MAILFLTKEELKDLTDLKRPDAICRWLRENGYAFDVAATGWPKVLRSLLELRLGLQQPKDKHRPRVRLPNETA